MRRYLMPGTNRLSNALCGRLSLVIMLLLIGLVEAHAINVPFHQATEPTHMLRQRRGRGGLRSYQLRQPTTIGPHQFFIRYETSDNPQQLTINTDRGSHQFDLPRADEVGDEPGRPVEWIEMRAPLPMTSRIIGFNLAGGDRRTRIIAAGLAPPHYGLRYQDAGVIIHGDALAQVVTTPTLSLYEYVLPRIGSEASPLQSLKLEYHYSEEQHAGAISTASGSASPHTMSLTVAGADVRRNYELRLRPGVQDVYLYAGQLGTTPEQLHITVARGLVTIRAVEMVAPPAMQSPIPAELGFVLRQRPAQLWRQHDYELFSWTLYPNILILDSRSYAIQAGFFKRLAFFSEKRGFRGQVLSDQALIPMHGWNAHNYRAHDLAAFFQAAQDEQVALNSYEELLRHLLLAHDIITIDTWGYYRAGSGGILGISQQSPPLLRRLLLIHESFHGLFYNEPEYRQAVGKLWQSLPNDQRLFWQLLFGALTYDPDSNYLMINEFQAYLMQQEIERVTGYFAHIMADRLIVRRPQHADFVRTLVASDRDFFRRNARAVADALWQHSGLTAADPFCLRPLAGS